jgi:hypothetical protein
MLAVTATVILLLPLIFVIVMRREEAGSMTVFTVRATPLRIYYSNSGSLGLAVRSDQDRLKDPGWLITRRNSVAWSLANAGFTYMASPYLLADTIKPQD